MKLRTVYGLKEKITDGRKLTLHLEWQYLTTAETKEVISHMGEVLQTVLCEQDMLFLGGVNYRKWFQPLKLLPWKAKSNIYIAFACYVRTQESAMVQKRRIKRLRKSAKKESSRESVPLYVNPYVEASREEGLALTRKYMEMEQKEIVVQGLPEEATVYFRQRYCPDGTYRLDLSISISGYAIGYALQNLTAEYKQLLFSVAQKTPLFAGYIYYENTQKGEFAYFHSCPKKINGHLGRSFGLLGYEWAAYMNKELAKELSGEQIEQLQQIADFSSVENGTFYQMRCDILQYGPEEKQRCRNILYNLLQPGYGYVSLTELYQEQMPIPQTTIYLLQPKYRRSGQYSILGFYHKTTPEESETARLFNVIEEIKIS